MAPIPQPETTTPDAARRRRVIQAERRALMNHLAWAQEARDRAEVRIILIAGELERLERELVGQAGR